MPVRNHTPRGKHPSKKDCRTILHFLAFAIGGSEARIPCRGHNGRRGMASTNEGDAMENHRTVRIGAVIILAWAWVSAVGTGAETAKSPTKNPEIRPAGSRSHTGSGMGSKVTASGPAGTRIDAPTASGPSGARKDGFETGTQLVSLFPLLLRPSFRPQRVHQPQPCDCPALPGLPAEGAIPGHARPNRLLLAG
jgi:hypothetical protein